MGFTVSGYKFLDGWARMVRTTCRWLHLNGEYCVRLCVRVMFLQVGLVAISVSLLGWLIFAICFGNFNNADNL